MTAMPEAAAHHEIWKYCQSTTKARAQVLQNLTVQQPLLPAPREGQSSLTGPAGSYGYHMPRRNPHISTGHANKC